tara:strand:- start:376 stop:543 length:168 start_codon:yes stop_codon:yes gene_type:complete
MELGKQKHFEECKKKIEAEGLELTRSKLLEMVKDLPAEEIIEENIGSEDLPSDDY